jgi:tRNA threonylcarbamoyladenosine dehydratase
LGVLYTMIAKNSLQLSNAWAVLATFWLGTNSFRLGNSGFKSASTELHVASPNKLFQNEPIEGIEIQERNLRFSGVGRLYATDSTSSNDNASEKLSPHLEVLDRLSASTVTVVGLGGVGSWAAEALCRSGIGTLVLIDLDDICISNTNRQLHATSTSVGKMKLDEMKRRLNDINPHCNVTLIHDFVTDENIYEILDSCSNITALLDAMDGTREKTALLAACVKRRIPVVTCGAAAGRMDPTKITVCDLTSVANDRLLATCRKSLRQKHGFEPGLSQSEMKKVAKKKRDWNVQAVFSTEVPKPVCQDSTSSFRRCDGPLGTACFVTGTFGFVASSLIVEMIARNKLRYPRQQGTNL